MSPIFKKLTDVRHELLRLHKALLDDQRIAYERAHGVVTPAEFLQVIINDPSFDWVHRLSELVVQIDEQMEDTENILTAASAKVLLDQVKTLLTPAETGEGFARAYFDAIQRNPEIAMMQGQIRKRIAAPLTA
ncbi:MAG: hypothetical protein QOE14_1678 [Humisphaera sp.]|nr:hypothetical protein [Humisphaera sp.]